MQFLLHAVICKLKINLNALFCIKRMWKAQYVPLVNIVGADWYQPYRWVPGQIGVAIDRVSTEMQWLFSAL